MEAGAVSKEIRYERHCPGRTFLYQLVEQYYPELADLMAVQSKPLLGYVRREFEKYLKCGRLEHGFLRMRCDSFHAEHLLALSFGFCSPASRPLCAKYWASSIALSPCQFTLHAHSKKSRLNKNHGSHRCSHIDTAFRQCAES